MTREEMSHAAPHNGRGPIQTRMWDDILARRWRIPPRPWSDAAGMKCRGPLNPNEIPWR